MSLLPSKPCHAGSARIYADPARVAVTAVTHAVGTESQRTACRQLIDQYQGPLAPGSTWPWLVPAREQVRRTAIDACSTLAEDTKPDDALLWLRRAIIIDPYNESLHHQAADLLAGVGDHGGAADLINRLHRRLAEEPHLGLADHNGPGTTFRVRLPTEPPQ